MDYGAALTAIESSDIPDKSLIVAAIKGQASTLLQEKRNVTGKYTAFIEAVEDLSEIVGAVGDEPVAKFKEAIKAVKVLRDDLRSTKTIAEESKTKAEELAKQVTAIGREAVLAKIATINDCNLVVLSTVLSETATDAIKIDGEKVSIAGVEYDEWLKSATIAPFAPVLKKTTKEPTLPTTEPEKSTLKLPTTPASGKTDEPDLYSLVLAPRALPYGHKAKS